MHRLNIQFQRLHRLQKIISKRIEDEARATYYLNNAPEEVVKAQQYQLYKKLSNPSFKRKGAMIFTEKKLKELDWD